MLADVIARVTAVVRERRDRSDGDGFPGMLDEADAAAATQPQSVALSRLPSPLPLSKASRGKNSSARASRTDRGTDRSSDAGGERQLPPHSWGGWWSGRIRSGRTSSAVPDSSTPPETARVNDGGQTQGEGPQPTLRAQLPQLSAVDAAHEDSFEFYKTSRRGSLVPDTGSSSTPQPVRTSVQVQDSFGDEFSLDFASHAPPPPPPPPEEAGLPPPPAVSPCRNVPADESGAVEKQIGAPQVLWRLSADCASPVAGEGAATLWRHGSTASDGDLAASSYEYTDVEPSNSASRGRGAPMLEAEVAGLGVNADALLTHRLSPHPVRNSEACVPLVDERTSQALPLLESSSRTAVRHVNSDLDESARLSELDVPLVDDRISRSLPPHASSSLSSVSAH